MSTTEQNLDAVRVADPEHWREGPPLGLFRELRATSPVHWSEGMSSFPDEPGFWSVTNQELVREVSRDWKTFSSELGGMVGMPWVQLEVQNGMFIGMDPPKHDRLKSLFQRGFTPKRTAEHEPAIREITLGVLNGLKGRESFDVVTDLAQPVVSRVIGSFMGIDPADDAIWARLMNQLVGGDDAEMNPEGPQSVIDKVIPEIVGRCQILIDARRAEPTDDLMSILVHAEIDGEMLSDWDIVMGFILLVTAGNDSTKATFSSGMKALLENPDERQKLIDDPTLIPGAVEECLRMFPAFAHFRRTATKDTELGGTPIKSGDKIMMWYPSTGRDETVYDDPDRFDVTRNPEHQAFGAGGRHFCLGTALARLELRVMFEETLKRFPNLEFAAPPRYATAIFVNQLTTFPVTTNA
ncbi:putative cytochrome P450 hydroxylase [Patulibacter medicamentivorans]|uniref:Putative cytochrome P450 hydroxylase n=1 Tax=Patulibacter medicamentivorans TaxID=1097667 RepID=H0E8C4_9ACTN|nr:cytochrome P450 [Patulibacter medicamentivorans]EHN10066.1 putative cytochrome P450 hydroxylase [Patulibacter medicamentivorans]